MRVNVDKVLERDQKLSELDDRADALQAGASQFETSAAKLKRKYWWKNCKVMLSWQTFTSDPSIAECCLLWLWEAGGIWATCGVYIPFPCLELGIQSHGLCLKLKDVQNRTVPNQSWALDPTQVPENTNRGVLASVLSLQAILGMAPVSNISAKDFHLTQQKRRQPHTTITQSRFI